MNLAWYARRLSRMSPQEITGRLRDAGIKRAWRNKRVPLGGEDKLRLPEAVPDFKDHLADFDASRIAKTVRTRVIDAADEAAQGRFHFFDRELEGLTPEDVDWFLDQRTGTRAPQDAYAFKVDIRDVAQVGTIKYVWEPSRHHQVTVLAGAYFLTGNERYAEAAAGQLRSWWDQNPFLSGVHWTSGIEIGVRLRSWVWVRRLLARWPGVKALFEDNPVCLRQLHHHHTWLATLPSHGSSANNHLIAEMAGLYAGACAFPWFAESERWRKMAARSLKAEIEKQTFECGLNKELASSYHRFVMELFVAAAVEGDLAGESLGPQYWGTVVRMMDALAAVMDVKGKGPRQGDGDDAHALLLDAHDYDANGAMLAAGAVWFGAMPWWPEFEPGDLRTRLWTALVKAPTVGAPTRSQTRPDHLEDAGMVLLRDQAHGPDEIWCRLDHGPHGFLSIAAHGHADALSMELRVGGVEILIDPGTYTYQGEPEWRAYFRSTLAHNCLELGGEDQSVSGGPFLWTKTAKSELLELDGLGDGSQALWRARHDGYTRLPQQAMHERKVTLDRPEGILIVEDKIDCSGSVPARLAFHLGPDVSCTLDGAMAVLSWKGEGARMRATLHLPETLSWIAVKGQETPPLGWYSPCFGSKVPITTLLGEGTAGSGTVMITRIEIGPADGAESGIGFGKNA